MIEVENVKKFAFLIVESAGDDFHMVAQLGENYDEVKHYVKRSLAPNWSIVEDVETIKSYIDNENSKERFVHAQTYWFYELLELLEKQLKEEEVSNMTNAMMNVQLTVALGEEQEERLYAFLQEELSHEEFVVLDNLTVDTYLLDTQKENLFAYNVGHIMNHLKREVALDVIRNHDDVSWEELRKSIVNAQENLYEGANSLIQALTDWKALILRGAELDGNGHFISPYDGEEHEIKFEGLDLLVYKA